MLNSPSWADALHASTTPREKAAILLQRAQQRTSKRLVAEDITEALRQLGHESTAELDTLLEYYGAPFTLVALRNIAQDQLRLLTK